SATSRPFGRPLHIAASCSPYRVSHSVACAAASKLDSSCSCMIRRVGVHEPGRCRGAGTHGALAALPTSGEHCRMGRADEWRSRGGTFTWRPSAGDAAEVQVFHVETGAADAPPIVLVHGFPTSSIDFVRLAELLGERYRVCAMDFPGFGFSDKPLGW